MTSSLRGTVLTVLAWLAIVAGAAELVERRETLTALLEQYSVSWLSGWTTGESNHVSEGQSDSIN